MGKIGVLNLCLSLFLLNLQSLARGDSHVVTEFNATEDSKLYRGLVLQNDLEVVLISDSNKHHKAAASLIVSDGKWTIYFKVSSDVFNFTFVQVSWKILPNLKVYHISSNIC